MIEGRTEIKRPFLSGTTRRIQFQIIDKETGVGFQPDTLTMSIYDVAPVPNGILNTVYRLSGNVVALPVASATVNEQDDVDVFAYVDSSGLVDLYLTPDDTDITVPAVIVAHPYQRRILFTWTWDTPIKTGKHEIVLSIAPDRETEAS